MSKVAKEIQELSAQLEKVAGPNRLYKYEIDGFVFFSPERKPQGFRLPTGRAKWTKEYYSIGGQLAKEVKSEEEDASGGDPDYDSRRDFNQKHI